MINLHQNLDTPWKKKRKESSDSSASPPPLTPMIPPPPPPPMAPPPPPPPPPLPVVPSPVSSARTEVKKNSQEGRQSEISGLPDLKALLAGKSQLKPVEVQEKPEAVDPMENILKMVRNGIKLRPVKRKEDTDVVQTDDTKFSTPSDSHLKLLHDRLNHINKFTRESSPESDSSDDGEFD